MSTMEGQSISVNNIIKPYVHSTDTNKTVYDITHDDIVETQTAFSTDRYRFRNCQNEDHYCTEQIMICTTCSRTSAPFIQFTCPEVAFGYVSNHGYGSGYNAFYLLATDYQPEDRDYTLRELLSLMDKGKLSVAYGGLSEVYRAHLLTEEVYNSYRSREWCEGGCGGCEDNWDYIDPYCVYNIFPMYSDMKSYKERCISFLRHASEKASG